MQHDTTTTTAHAFRDTLAELVGRYVEHHTAATAAPDAGERKRAGDRRRRALAALASYAETVRATLGDDGAALSGGYRRALEAARASLPEAARAALDGLPVEDRRTWDPSGLARCPACDHVGELAEDFGARLDTLTVPTGDVASLRARWLADTTLAPRQRARIEGFRPYLHPTKEGHSYMLGPYRQSNCKPCRNAAARRAAEGV